MIEISQLEDRDRKRKVVWQPSPHMDKFCILVGWTKTELILAVPTGKKKNPAKIEQANPRDVAFREVEG